MRRKERTSPCQWWRRRKKGRDDDAVDADEVAKHVAGGKVRNADPRRKSEQFTRLNNTGAKKKRRFTLRRRWIFRDNRTQVQ